MSGTAPTPLGGAISDGTYFLTAFNEYGSSVTLDAGLRYTLTIAGSIMQSVSSAPTLNDGGALQATTTITTNGTTLGLTITCPMVEDAAVSYRPAQRR